MRGGRKVPAHCCARRLKMNVTSVTGNPPPAVAVQPTGRASGQPEVRSQAERAPAADTSRPAAPRQDAPSMAQQTRAAAQENEQAVREAVDNIERFISQNSRDIAFAIDQEDGFMVKVIDRSSQDVIVQMPSKEAIAIAKALDKLQGIFVRDKI
jgi:flagellar protein FlaG